MVLRDGRTVHLRAARSEDQGAVEDYLIGLSDESRRLRFWSTSIDVTDLAAKAVRPEYPDHLTLLALTGGDAGHVVGGAQFIRENATRAELSVSVSDELQGSGLGSLLVGNLVDAAYEAGIGMLEAQVLPENHRMIDVFRKTGFPISIRAKPGAVSVEIATAPTEDAVAHFEEREAVAAASAVRTILEPETVAVIGASRDEASIGGRLLRNLLTHPFKGTVYPVNPSAPAVQGVKAYATIDDVPGPVDVAFIAVKAPLVAEVAEVVRSEGRARPRRDLGRLRRDRRRGPARQRELVEICRRWGMRLVGPNCMGVVNTDPDVDLNGTFATIVPEAGSVGFLSQSGAVGIAVMSETSRRGIGLSSFVSVGNKADISGNDMLSYWEGDARTSVILLYLESFGNPRRFSHLARRIGKRKPIVAVKSGRTQAGQRAAGSHTGSLVGDVRPHGRRAVPGERRDPHRHTRRDVRRRDAARDPAARPWATASGSSRTPVGSGSSVPIPARRTGSSCPLSPRRPWKSFSTFLPSEASTGNPVDMIASATGEDYERAVLAVASDPNVDIVIVIYIPPLEQHADDVARGIGQAIGKLDGGTPVLTSFMSGDEVPVDPVERAGDGSPRSRSRSRPRSRPLGPSSTGDGETAPPAPCVASPTSGPMRPTAILASALSRGSGWLEPEEVDGLLDCYGIPVASIEAGGHAGGGGALRGRVSGSRWRSRPSARCTRATSAVFGWVSEVEEMVVAHATEMQERLRAIGRAADGILRPGDGRGRGDARRRHARRGLRADRRVRRRWHDRGAAEGRRRAGGTGHGRRGPGDGPFAEDVPAPRWLSGAPRANVAALEEVLLRVSALASDRGGARWCHA